MPKYEGVYQDAKGRWYFKVWVGRDPLTGRQVQVTKRGFPTAADAARARRKVRDEAESLPTIRTLPATLTVDELLDHCLDGLDADGKLSAKTRFDYRHNATTYVRPWLGKKRVRDVTPEVVLAWQRKLLVEGGAKSGRPLPPNTVRLARSPLAGAFKLAVAQGLVRMSPVATVSKPPTPRSILKHWTPGPARAFLGHQEGDPRALAESLDQLVGDPAGRSTYELVVDAGRSDLPLSVGDLRALAAADRDASPP